MSFYGEGVDPTASKLWTVPASPSVPSHDLQATDQDLPVAGNC